MTREITDNPSGWSRSLPGHSIEYTPGFIQPWHYYTTKSINAGQSYDYDLTFLDTEHIYFVDSILVSPQAYSDVLASFLIGSTVHANIAGTGYAEILVRHNPAIFFIAGDKVTARATNLGSGAHTFYISFTGTRINRPSNFGRAPTAWASFSSHAINAGQSIVATDASVYSPTSWIWEWGDGSADSTEQNPTHTYNTPGSYYPKLKAVNQYGFDYFAESTPIVVS